MKRAGLLELLENYFPTDAEEQAAKVRMLEFVRAHEDCFERSCIPGHITGSCWLVNFDKNKALLTHHAKLGLWMQLGGHCDGDSDVLAVALKEACEESGLENIVPVSPDIFDLDVHLIPARGDIPAHYHYDVRFLLQSITDEPFVVSHESKDLAWIGKDRALCPTKERSVVRMFDKWAR